MLRVRVSSGGSSPAAGPGSPLRWYVYTSMHVGNPPRYYVYLTITIATTHALWMCAVDVEHNSVVICTADRP